jgi:hypothetical protein
MKNLYPLLLLCLFISRSHAQKKEKPEEYPWMMNERIYLSDSTGVGNQEFSSKKSGLVFVNNNAQVSKGLETPGRTLGIAKWKGNVLVFYVSEWDGKPVKEIHALLADAKTKTVLSDKVIWQNPGDAQIECRIGKDEEGQFRYLLIRTSALTGDPGRSLSDKELKKKLTTTALQALLLSDKMEATLQPLSSAVTGGMS